jgi:hypothetical protein
MYCEVSSRRARLTPSSLMRLAPSGEAGKPAATPLRPRVALTLPLSTLVRSGTIWLSETDIRGQQ